MKDDAGVKWACDACIKGHRVSGCNHTDRPLKVIAPKGRPVKQCEHCRVARKSKSHHAKCDCGEKKEKTKASAKVDAHVCCCHHGAKCICGLKVDTLDPISETQPLKLSHHSNKSRPGLSTAHSESTLTVFANGHHKPCHRLNNLAHTSGAPYRIPRPHSLHASHAQQEQITERLRREAYNQNHRSVDDLLLLGNGNSIGTNNNSYGLFNNSQRSRESLPITPLTGNFETDFGSGSPQKTFSNGSQSIDYDDNQLARTVSRDSINSQPWLWIDPNSSATNSQFGLDSLSTSPTGDYFPGNEADWAIPSAGTDFFSPSDLPLNTDLSETYTTPISQSGESNHASAPGLTGSSSGAQSEVGETGFFGDLDAANQQPTPEYQTGDQNGLQFGDALPYRLGSTFQDTTLSRVQSYDGDAENRRSLDLNLLRRPSDDFLVQSNDLGFNAISQSLRGGYHGLPSSATTSPPRANPAMAPAMLQRATSFPEFAQSQSESMYNNYMRSTGTTARSITIPADPTDSENWTSFPELDFSFAGVHGLPYTPQEEATPSWL